MISSTYFKTFVFYALAFAGHFLSVNGGVLVSGRTTGCSKPHVVDGVSKNFQLSTNGGTRTYRLHLPRSYDPNTPAPLVISFHGHGQDMVPQETLSQFSNDAVNPNMIAVFPQGLKGAVSRVSLYSLIQSNITTCIEKWLSSTTDQLLRAASDLGKENSTQRPAFKTGFSQATSSTISKTATASTPPESTPTASPMAAASPTL